jgi:hypothetical protein
VRALDLAPEIKSKVASLIKHDMHGPARRAGPSAGAVDDSTSTEGHCCCALYGHNHLRYWAKSNSSAGHQTKPDTVFRGPRRFSVSNRAP